MGEWSLEEENLKNNDKNAYITIWEERSIHAGLHFFLFEV